MNISPEMQAQINEQKKQCVYCKIVSKEIPGKVIYDDDVTQAVIDIYPAKKGHAVFFLKEHYPIMPYIPGNEFKHFFGLMPQLSKALKSGMVATGVNIFIANGWVAGQQFPHVLVHMFPRENGDGFFNYLFDKRNSKLDDARTKVFQNIFPQMMTNHFGRHPASWHVGKGDIPAHLTGIYESNTVVYEDEKVLCVLPENAIVDGHLEIYSKTEEKYLENLSIDDSAHLFFTASLATTLAFENLGLGQNSGTNIIVKSGESDDNPGGKLVVHILPRVENDTLKNLAWQPSQPKYNLDDVQKKLKDKTWTIKYSEEEAPKQEPQTIPESPKTILSNEDEIKDAIMRLHE